MATNTLNIVDITNIQSFSIKVTEKIQKKYLLDFLRTSLENKVDIDTDLNFYASFISSSLTYEILSFKGNLQHSFPEPFIFITECHNAQKELFITENYFCIFDSKKLLFYRDIENILHEDIQTYIEQLYKIKIDKVSVIQKSEYERIKNNFQSQYNRYTFDFYPLKKDNSFKIFSAFIVLVIVLFIFALYTAVNKKTIAVPKSETKPFYEKGYKKLLLLYNKSKNKPIEKIIDFCEYIINCNINMEQLQYKNGKLYFVLYNKKRKKLLHVISNYTEEIKIHSLKFDKSTNRYTMEAELDVKK